MGWLTSLLVLASFHYISAAPFSSADSLETTQNYPLRRQDNNIDDNTVSEIDSPTDPEEDLELRKLGHYLAEILVQRWPSNDLPLLYIEPEKKNEEIQDESYTNFLDNNDISKRSRYYRKYPWKRQNPRNPYEAENRYMCQPSKDDVFRLLVALHEARQGNKGRTIHFCNRKRPAASIFTNIRFLGRRK